MIIAVKLLFSLNLERLINMLQNQAIIATNYNELCSMYSKYFSNVVKSQGVPHLNADQFVRYQNIIALEYFINLIKKIGVSHSLFGHVSKAEKNLERLTKKLSPEELLQEMIELSY